MKSKLADLSGTAQKNVFAILEALLNHGEKQTDTGRLGITRVTVLRKEGNVIFNDALNTFYLQLYHVVHTVKDHSVSMRGNPLPPHGLLFPISSRFFLYAPCHRQDGTYHSLCYTSRGALAGTRNIIKELCRNKMYLFNQF